MYEVVWMRQLELTVGVTTGAVSALLAVFMAGLGAGARLFGPVADRTAAPLRVYGYVEVGIGLYALAVPALLGIANQVYLGTLGPAVAHPTALLLLRLAYASSMLLVPTLLMGGTLPLLVRFVLAADPLRERRLGSSLGALYGANLAGAFLGTIASGFVLIRVFGLLGATVAAATVNLSVGVAAVAWDAWHRRARTTVPAGPVAAPAPVDEAAGASPAAMAWTAVVLSGFVSFGYQVLWTRILTFAFTSTVYSFTIILATVLAGLALGSGVFALLDRRIDRLRMLAFALLLGAATSAASARVSVALPAVITGVSERWGYTGEVFLAATALSSALVILVPATLMGLVFPLASRLLVSDPARAGRRIGAAYVANTAGAVAGALVTGFLLIPWLGLAGTLFALAGAQLAAGAAFLTRLPGPRVRPAGLAVAAAATAAFAVGATGLVGPQPFDTALVGQAVVVEAARDGVSASTSVVRYADGRRALRIDGFEAAGEGGTYGYMNMMTHVPVLLHPDPRRILVICFGTGTTAGAALLYPGLEVDAVDVNETVFEFAPFFRDVNRGVAADPRARLVVDDGRSYLASTSRVYDVITSEPMPPTYAGVVRLYSREYYQLAHQRLRPGGYLAQWLPFHLLRPEDVRSVVRTVQDVFAETTVWVHGETGIVVARRGAPVTIDVPTVGARLAENAFELSRLGVAEVEDFAALFMVGPLGAGRMGATAASITDDRPSLEFHPPRHRTVVRVGWGYRPDEARGLEIVYRMRDADTVPLGGASPGQAEEIERRRRVRTRLLLGELYRALWLGEAARAEFEAGLREEVTPAERSLLLERQAEAALLPPAGPAR